MRMIHGLILAGYVPARTQVGEKNQNSRSEGSERNASGRVAAAPTLRRAIARPASAVVVVRRPALTPVGLLMARRLHLLPAAGGEAELTWIGDRLTRVAIHRASKSLP
jgi:hypothetical protein